MRGSDIRLARLMGKDDGRSFIVAADHAFMMGPAEGTYDLEATLLEVLRGNPDGILLGCGRARQLAHLFEGSGRPSLIVRADWFSAPRIFSDHAPMRSIDKFVAVSAGQAFAAGADALMAYYLAGFTPDFEEVCRAHMSRLLLECECLGLPLVMEPLIGNPSLSPVEKNGLLLEAARMIEAQGASALKVPFVSESGLEVLTGAVGVPVWVLGGDKVEESEACVMAARYMELGARGIVFGRNVIQAADPGAAALRLREIVHGS
jgi:fructose-bisphosphate aldolase, class I